MKASRSAKIPCYASLSSTKTGFIMITDLILISFTPYTMGFTHQHQQWDREAYSYAGDVYFSRIH